MNNDTMGFKNIIDLVRYDKDGNITGAWHTENQVQTLAKEYVVDAFDLAVSTPVIEMAIGTKWGAGVASACLWNKVCSGVCTTVDNTSYLSCASTFTNVSGTISEAGLFKTAGCASGMYFYSDSVGSVVMTTSDSLAITWTITPS